MLQSGQALSSIPDNIPELGDGAQIPRLNPEFNPSGDGSITSEDYFVLSRVDGATSLHQLIIMAGVGAERAMDILRKLRRSGAFLLNDETPASIVELVATAARESARADQVTALTDLTDLSEEEEAAISAEVDMAPESRLRVLAMLRVARQGDLLALLEVDESVNRRQLKRSYFKLSKEFHPDRYYNRELGPFRPYLAEVFEAAGRAVEVLSDDRRRARYLAGLRGESSAPSRAQTREEHAGQLFDQACDAEVSQDFAAALRFFAAAARVNPDARIMRRAANCALSAGELKTAEEYAKQAADLEPKNPSFVRLLANVYRAQGKLQEAEQTLVRAVGLRTENDVLAGELARDLAEVRTLLGADASR